MPITRASGRPELSQGPKIASLAPIVWQSAQRVTSHSLVPGKWQTGASRRSRA